MKRLKETVFLSPLMIATVLLLICSNPTWTFGSASGDATGSASPSLDSSGQAKENGSASTIVCESQSAERNHCPADTSTGVMLNRSTGSVECLLGKTWGYDYKSVWVSDGCSGEFAVGPVKVEEAAATSTEAPSQTEHQRIETWGEFDPGKGFLIGKNSFGQLSVSGYALLRWIDQTPADQTFTDHLGNERPVDTRNDIYSHRVMVFFMGWLANPKLVYAITFWTVNTTDQRAIFGNLGYQFSRKFSIYGGLNGLPGTRSLQGSHPFWLAPDRVMADEFFRPYFGSGIWAQGEPVPGLWYNVVLANNSSSLGVKSSQLDRTFSTGASVWWMPTTKEFGPRGAYGDWEMHDKVATRFGVSTAFSPEERFTDANTYNSGNTTIRLADSVNVFDEGALATGVTVQRVKYNILSLDAGVKYKGIFLQTEYYNRWLNHFEADGSLPVTSIHDTGFYVQAAFYPVPKKLELYGATSQIFGDKAAGFDNSSEYLLGTNFYPFHTRNNRLNFQVLNVNHSPVSSAFGYYIGGQNGTTMSSAFSVFF